MTLQACLPFPYPASLYSAADAVGYASGVNSLLDAAGEQWAYLFRAPKSGNISTIGFRTGTVTTGAAVDVRLETVDPATGDPTGTLKAANANATQTILDGDDNTWFDTALTAAAAVSAGDWLAAVITAPGGFAGTLNLAYGNVYGLINQITQRQYYLDHYVASAWTKRLYAPIGRIGYDDATFPFIPGLCGANSLSSYVYDSADTPDEYGIYFQLPFSARATGWWASVRLQGDAIANLYDSDGSTVLASTILDFDIVSSTNMPNGALFANPQTLAKDTFYRLTLLGNHASNVLRLAYAGVSSTAHWEQMGLSTDVQQTSRVDGGAWTQDNTAYPMMGLILDQVDDGAGGGGLAFIQSRRNTLIGR